VVGRVEAGETLSITVGSREVAELSPVSADFHAGGSAQGSAEFDHRPPGVAEAGRGLLVVSASTYQARIASYRPWFTWSGAVNASDPAR